MRIFFDTEFLENGKTIELISIGLVREDDVAYYAETTFGRMWCEESGWLRQHVLPHLIGEKAVKHKSQIQKDIVAFVGAKPEFWAYYASYDWVVLCQLFGRMIDLPKGWPMYVNDVKQLCVQMGNLEMPKQEGTAHHALMDARQCKEMHTWLMRQRR